MIASLLFLLYFVSPAAAEPFVPGQALDERLVAQVTASALAFMAPRTLEPVPVWQLALWGLRGLTTLDPRLAVELRDGTLRLSIGGRILAARAPPAPDDAGGWGEATAQLVRAGWDASEAVRRAGTQGVVRTFFDELFNHLDPYSRYAPPADAAADRERRAGRAGIGVQVMRSGGGFVVQDVAADGPAAQAGVHAGDRILAVDGQTTQGADLESVNALLAGPEGTPVSVSLRGRDGRAAQSRPGACPGAAGDGGGDAGGRSAGAAHHRLRQRHRRAAGARNRARPGRAAPAARPGAGPARQSRRAAAPGRGGGRHADADGLVA